MSNFPTSISTNANLYIAVDNVQTTLALSCGSTDTTLTLTSTTNFPNTGFVTLDFANVGNAEVVYYANVIGNTITGCVRGIGGTTAQSHNANAPVGLTVVAEHHNVLKDEIIAIETSLGVNLSNVQAAGSYITALTGDVVATGPGSVVATIGTITHALNLGSHLIHNVTDPVSAQDAATKNYVDTRSPGTGTVNSGTAGHLPYYATTGTTLSDSGLLLTDIPTLSASQNIFTGAIYLDGNLSMQWPSVIRLFDSGHSNNITIEWPSIVTTYAITLPAAGPAATNTVLQFNSAGNSSFNTILELGDTAFSGALVLGSGSGMSTKDGFITFLQGDGTSNTQILAASTGGFRQYTLPDTGSSTSTFVMTDGTQAINGQTTLANSAGNPIHGTSTNDNAAAGYIGEYIKASVAAGGAITLSSSGVFFNITSIALTAGDWDVSGIAIININGTPTQVSEVALSTFSGNTLTGHVLGDNVAVISDASAAHDSNSLVVPAWRVSLSAPATIYIKAMSIYTGTASTAYGRISARRVR